MEPFPFDSDDSFGVKPYPIIPVIDNSIESYISTLDSATKEAVIRNQDQFKTRSDVEQFVEELRD